jgi:hypothetical protein
MLRSKQHIQYKIHIFSTWGAQDEYLDVNPPTLAQRLGVIPHETISLQWGMEWNKGKGALYCRKKDTVGMSPICVQGFPNSKQILFYHADIYIMKAVLKVGSDFKPYDPVLSLSPIVSWISKERCPSYCHYSGSHMHSILLEALCL